ncbi:MAG: hypothetical protein HQL32_17005 [Planctomycetes bacterium]|nr:hypothetical protein [Planctomycetota bacterium]
MYQDLNQTTDERRRYQFDTPTLTSHSKGKFKKVQAAKPTPPPVHHSEYMSYEEYEKLSRKKKVKNITLKPNCAKVKKEEVVPPVAVRVKPQVNKSKSKKTDVSSGRLKKVTAAKTHKGDSLYYMMSAGLGLVFVSLCMFVLAYTRMF